MNKQEITLRNHAHTLLSSLVYVHNAKVGFEVLAAEKDVHKGTQKKIQQSVTECNQIRQRFDRFWGEEGKKIMDAQILSDEDSLQMINIQSLVQELPKALRNEVENYIQSRVNIYALNKK